MATKSSVDEIIQQELLEIKSDSKLSSVQFIACHKALVQARIKFTDMKHIVVNIQFPLDYPISPLLMEINSKVLPDKLMKKMETMCDQELKKHKGSKQVSLILSFLCDFMMNSPLLVCSEEITYLKNEIYRDGDDMKIKHKTGTVLYKASQDGYFLEFKIAVPYDYPAVHIQLDFKESNLPTNLIQIIKGHSSELLRQCVEAPIRRNPKDVPFVPQPSLQLIVSYLIVDCLRRLPIELCHVCNERALPSNPKDILNDEGHPRYVYRIYCGHLYHFQCLDNYMKTPPFTGGKKCIKCGQRVFHDKWNIPPRLAEERWAHQEARKREIAEVAEFLGFD